MAKLLAYKILFLLILPFLSMSYFDNAYALETTPEQLKAAYIIHLSEFTTWPSEKMSSSFFTICLSKNSLLSKPLEQIEGHLVKGKTLRILYDVSIEEVDACHVFYVEDTFNNEYFLQTLFKKSAVLTISSDALFVQKGGIIEYYPDNKSRVKMRVNLKAMNQTGLTMSYKVLRLMDSNF